MSGEGTGRDAAGSSGGRGGQRGKARERAAQARAQQQAAARRRTRLRWATGAGVVVVLVVVGVVVGTTTGGSHSAAKPAATTSAATAAPAEVPAGATTTTLGPEAMDLEVSGPLLASNASTSSGGTVDGITCGAESVAEHIHTHLAVYVNGVLRPIPLGVGIVGLSVDKTAAGGFAQATGCYYWLHTHAQDGVIHIEAPVKGTYTLGQFFDVWREPLSATQVASVKGAVTAYVDGKRYTGDPADIPFAERRDIQLDIGTPAVAPKAVDWSKSQL